MNIAETLADSAARESEGTALILDDVSVSYAELDTAGKRIAGLLAERGIGPGDRVGVMLPNVVEFAPVYFGVLRAGAVVVPMNPLLKAREVEYYLSDSGARLLFSWHTTTDEVEKGIAGSGGEAVNETVAPGQLPQGPVSEGVADRAADDTAVILYTSGTTGRPKGAELTHSNLLRNVEVTQSDLLDISTDDVVFGGLPLFHAFGQTVTLNTTVAVGATLVLLSRFDPVAALNLMAQHGVTVFAGVPTMYSAFLAVADPPSLPALRVCVSGGAALPVEVLRRFETVFGCEVLEGYGLSETSPVASFNRPGTARKPGSIGTPVTGVEMRVVDADGAPVPDGEVGEIAIRGHNVMKGYWRKPDETKAAKSEDGWFATGDMGKVDEEGFFYIVDRKKELVIRGGFNVYPREIEEVLYEHPAVSEAAVIGIPHAELGEEIGAAVVLRPGTSATTGEIRAYVKERVAPYKYPRVVWILDEMPKGPTGKIQKRDLVVPNAAEQVRG
ncbi:long-chain-fatty-acid--CoA ligase [Williamsia sterculiae]|uniref:Long-chain acyl-CoA synthetase n=1 Tax=Williamsia sterculiae TaxID=1344003 RepID=A0A1N7GZK6_9NOCA|nr:long-chain fatty acid--CoA ligase [Williamsia sterculiae]SIS17878.1 long-chain acyl-CoA synthetase [Williamsia sterculiae]